VVQGLYAASSKSQAHFDLDSSARASTKSLVIDTIAHIMGDSDLSDYKASAEYSQARNIDISEEDVLWNTLRGGLIHQDYEQGDASCRRTAKTDRAAYNEWQAWRIDASGDVSLRTPAALNFATKFSAVSVHRNFITTRKGYIGWAPKQAVKGDLVVLMPGGKVPYILRPIRHGRPSFKNMMSRLPLSKRKVTRCSNEATIRHYTFLDDAYIQGIMYGEAWDEGKLEDIILV
jgi:hypothetical protein